MSIPTQADLIQAVRAAGVHDSRVHQAFRTVPRARFVPTELVDRAYFDEPLPIAHGQVTTQPSLVAQMVAALALGGTEGVLEVGTGYGFQTALLASLSEFVWTVERWADLAEAARANLARQGAHNVEVVVGDGSEGLASHAPYGAIVISAAFPRVPPPLVEQLADGGRLVQPVGWGGDEQVTLFGKRGEGLVRVKEITVARFVPLVGRHGFSAQSDRRRAEPS